MKAILILCDSLNRHFLGTYGGSEARTPNLDALAADSAVFENHWIGSSPCMPARRDIFTGRLEFLERGWGALEPFDVPFTSVLRKHGIFCHMITDHYHYWESTGEHYCQSFDTFEFIRGHEYDPWVSKAGEKYALYPGTPEFSSYAEKELALTGQHVFGVQSSQYKHNRQRFLKEGFPCERTFKAASQWVRDNQDADDVFLMVEAFDPHEPFDCPDEFKQMYGIDPETPGDYSWSSYWRSEEPSDAVEKLRRNYMANLTFLDNCLGQFLDTLSESGWYDDTLILLTTDHGHLVGEHGYTGKNVMPLYNEIAHIPLFLRPPKGCEKKKIGALTQNIDLYPTITEYFGAGFATEEFIGVPPIQGRSLWPLVTDYSPADISGMSHVKTIKDMGNQVSAGGHEWALFGVFGQTVNYTDGRYTYHRTHTACGNGPLFAYTAVPSAKRFPGQKRDLFEKIDTGRFLSCTRMPVFKIPVDSVWLNDRYLAYNKKNLLFNLIEDYAQNRDLSDGGDLEQKMEAALIRAMEMIDAPEEQFLRLGLKASHQQEVK